MLSNAALQGVVPELLGPRDFFYMQRRLRVGPTKMETLPLIHSLPAAQQACCSLEGISSAFAAADPALLA
jgi:hypothetical protein